MANAGLATLPEELLVKIATFINPSSLPAFASVSKLALRCSEDLLRQHMHWDREYRIVHDTQPLAVPDLLRKALKDCPQTWHLRRFESWCARPKWSSWRTVDDVRLWDATDNAVLPSPSHDFSHLDASYYSNDDVRAIEDVMRSQLHFEEAMVDRWMDCIRSGRDEPLKGVLLALAPRLREGIFIAYPQASGYHQGRHPFLFLTQAITRLAATPNPSWPPGFLSLQKISVCSPTDLRHPHDMYYAPARDVTPLFKLPNIKILMLGLLGYGDDDEGIDLEPACSSVEALRFYCCDVSDPALLSMMLAARSLKTLQISGHSNRLATYVSESPLNESLEMLRIDANATLKPNPAILSRITSLRCFQKLHLMDLIVPADDPNQRRSDMLFTLSPKLALEISDSDPKHQFALLELAEVLPPSLEILELDLDDRRWRGVSLQRFVRSDPRVASILLNNVARLAEDPRFYKLSLVCLFRVVGIRVEHREDNGQSRAARHPLDEFEFTWDEQAYSRIVANGIDVHRRFGPGSLQQTEYYEETRAHKEKHKEFEALQDVHLTDLRASDPENDGKQFGFLGA